MRMAAVSTNRRAIETQRCEAPASSAWPNSACLGQRDSKGTPMSQGCHVRRSDRKSRKIGFEPRNQIISSRRAAACGRRELLIREEIIGHRMRPVGARLGGGQDFRSVQGTLPLLHQPARQHGGGIFLKPLVKQVADLFAEIRGVTQSGEFVALQRIARGRKQELPRRLGLVTGHKLLLRGKLRVQ
jgi:hypothetical protein